MARRLIVLCAIVQVAAMIIYSHNYLCITHVALTFLMQAWQLRLIAKFWLVCSVFRSTS